MAKLTDIERFDNMWHYEPSPNLPKPCKIWHRGLNEKGYGQFTCKGKNNRAHRWHYKTVVNPNLPDDIQLDHLCRRHGCVELSHLDPCDNGENNRRKWLALNLSKVIAVYIIKTPLNIYK